MIVDSIYLVNHSENNERYLIKKNKKKKKTFHIACGGFYHKGIYSLAGTIYEKLMMHEELFPWLPQKQMTDCIHPLGILIMSSRTLYTRTDIYNISDESFKDIVPGPEQKQE